MDLIATELHSGFCSGRMEQRTDAYVLTLSGCVVVLHFNRSYSVRLFSMGERDGIYFLLGDITKKQFPFVLLLLVGSVEASRSSGGLRFGLIGINGCDLGSGSHPPFCGTGGLDVVASFLLQEGVVLYVRARS